MLEVKNLTKRFGGKKVVDGVSFSIKPGEIFGLLGPNGAGKTTLISMIMTLQEPDEGEVWVNGVRVADDPKRAKRLLGFVPQELIDYHFFSVEQVLTYHFGYHGFFGQKKRIEELLKRFALWEKRDAKVGTLSGGMKRRLLIVKALLHKPKVLLLDEPSAGVDIELRQSLWALVRELRDEGVAILLTTHYLEEAEELCDRVAFLGKGKVRRMDTTTAFLARARAVTLQMKEGPLSLELPYAETIGALLATKGIALHDVLDIAIEEPSLEKVFTETLWEEE